jgi:DNA-binding NtrC family response regulator
MPMAAQAKLLRVLEEKAVCRVGSSKTSPVDFRLVAATNRDLLHVVSEGEFREDLYYRVSALPLQVPSLAERASDIPAIAGAVLARMGKSVGQISEDAMRLLMEYEWPGNIRELRNALVRAMSVSEDHTIRVQDLPPSLQASCGRRVDVRQAEETGDQTGGAEGVDHARSSGQSGGPGSPGALHRVNAETEAAHIVQALELNHGNMVRTAKYLKISRATLYEKCKKYGIRRPG